ncbi:MAG: HNH endonuclease [Xenococcaceae cyanobacterium]
MKCELCDREMERLTVHHLIPRQTVKRKQAERGSTINICSACHRQIHTLFDNTQLGQHLNTIDKLKDEPRMEKFLSWLKKQDPNKRVRVYRQR